MIHIRNIRVDIHKVGGRAFELIARMGLYALITAGAILFGLPFFWMVRTSIMPPWQIYTIPPEWIPAELHLGALIKPWRDLPFAVLYKNTATISFLSTAGLVLSSSLVAYGFARLRFPGRDILFMLVLASMMLPKQITLIPQYLIFTKLGWVNTLKPLIIPFCFGGAYHIFLIRQFIMTIPLEMDDAAKIDGCGSFGIYWRIILPLSVPVLGAVAIMHFMWSWNWYLGPLIYLNTLDKSTLCLGLLMFRDEEYGIEMDALMAGTLQAILPAIALFFVAQKYFIQGIVITGVKG